MSSRKRKGYGSVQTSFSLEDADKCKARPTTRCPSKTMQNDSGAERKCGILRSHGHRAAADALSNMTIGVRVPHHTPQPLGRAVW